MFRIVRYETLTLGSMAKRRRTNSKETEKIMHFHNWPNLKSRNATRSTVTTLAIPHQPDTIRSIQ